MLAGMSPFADLGDLPRQLRHPAVRDLAWTLFSPPLLERVGSLRPRHPLQASGWAARPGRLEDWLRELDRQPQALLAQLPATAGNRLGRYYEQLWQFALAQAPDVRLLAANLVIRDGGHTLGEMDLLLEDDDGLQHIELAVKFYLGPAQADGQAARDWLGPGRLDRLDLKLDHLLQQQLRLGELAETRLQLQRLTPKAASASLWLGGYLFYPWPAPCSAPQGAGGQHLHGDWVRRRDWPAWQAAHPGSWQPLPRMRWLAPAACATDECWSDARLAAWLAELPSDAAPRMLVRLAPDGRGDWQECSRVFLVDDHWPQVATPAPAG